MNDNKQVKAEKRVVMFFRYIIWVRDFGGRKLTRNGHEYD